MNTLGGPLLLFAITGVWFSLALVPSAIEWSRKTDATPLRVEQENEGDIRHFAYRFREYLEHNFDRSVRRSTGVGRTTDGTPFRVMTTKDDPVFTSSEKKRRLVRRLSLIYCQTELPPDTTFAHDVYVAENISCGNRDIFRGLLADKNVTLGEGCVVSRWMHARGNILAGPNCTLYGRLSSDRMILLSAPSVFQRMNAAAIVFDEGSLVNIETDRELDRSRETIENIIDRWLIKGDIEIPTGATLSSNVVASGDVWIGAGSRITGSVKSNGNMFISDSVVIAGSIVSAGDLTIGKNCHFLGPVIAERNLLVGEHSRLGTSKHPTTATARRIVIHSGCVAFGTVWAKERGEIHSEIVRYEAQAA